MATVPVLAAGIGRLAVLRGFRKVRGEDLDFLRALRPDFAFDSCLAAF